MAMPLYTSTHVSISLPITKNCIKSYFLLSHNSFHTAKIQNIIQTITILRKKKQASLCTCATVIAHRSTTACKRKPAIKKAPRMHCLGAIILNKRDYAYSALITALWTAFQPAAFRPQLFVRRLNYQVQHYCAKIVRIFV